MFSPCKNCPDRHYKCHSECEKYIKFLAENEKRKEYLRFENKLTDVEVNRIKKRRSK